MARIILADDHALVRDAISMFLAEGGRHQVCAAVSVEETESCIVRKGVPDLVLLDYRMPGMEDLAGLNRIRALLPNVPVALISGSAGTAVAAAALEAGAAGFLPKTMTPDELISAIDTILAGQVFAPELPGDDALANMLTRREFDVLRGVSKGLSNKEIARDLNLTEVTVKLHVKTMCRKLSARNRTHAAMRALEMGLL
ncbi:response regulator transcription factor [Pseudooceanicola sp.]|uniref:response regulator transcription factor n=1 Tax=Pseudooceanicola sp. TaxID=1914328 RepID=UPI002608E93B|nr:response regulator transcription factor [Pseudooceanicola sp.]MDF1854074.1 response regulator transcription factor [Pseudooceanicola sp.]